MQLSTAEFFAAFFYAVSIFYPESVDPDLKTRDTPQENLQPNYDFIIVGAGSAGCVLANRLSEVESWNILLIEAGGDENAVSDAPLLFSYLANTDLDWNYTSVPQRYACLSMLGICPQNRGHVLGGSSVINYMYYVRGNKADYDEWAALGNTGWSYEDVLPYFIKLENTSIPLLRNSPYRGRDGYYNVQFARYDSRLQSRVIQAGLEMGWQEGDYNGERQDVIGQVQLSVDGPSRESTSKAYLNPIRNRPNLNVIKRSEVSKIIIEGSVAKGVEYYRNGKKYVVYAKKEIILSAGAFGSPKLLMLSGIGPKQELLRHGIRLLADLPVGEVLQDHPLLSVNFLVDSNDTITGTTWKTNSSILEYARDKDGPLTTTGFPVVVFLNSQRTNETPNIQITWSDAPLGDYSQNRPVIGIGLALVHPKSKGWLKLKSNNWRDPPLINPNYISHQDDLTALQEGIEIILDFVKTPTIAKLKPRFYSAFYPLCVGNFESIFRRELINCLIRKYSTPYYHPVSTAKMGPSANEDTVVTPDLLVKGFTNLRVIDASVMPTIPRANTNVPTIMIAEKGSDIIKNHYNIYS